MKKKIIFFLFLFDQNFHNIIFNKKSLYINLTIYDLIHQNPKIHSYQIKDNHLFVCI